MQKYYEQRLKNKVDRDLMLIKMCSGKDRFAAIVWLILKSGIPRKKIYVYGERQSGKKTRFLKKVLGVRYLNKKNERFYNVLAKAKYIYWDENLDDFFIKKHSQVLYLYNSRKDRRTPLYDNAQLKADVIEKKTIKDTRQFADVVRSRQEVKAAENKKRTLILVNKAYIPNIKTYLSYLFDLIDYSKNEVILFVESLDDPEEDNGFDFVDPHVIIASKSGKMSWNRKKKQANEHYLRIANRLTDETDTLTDGEKKAVQNMYGFEKNRVLGNHHYDTVINFGFATNYWLSLIYSIPCDRLYMLIDEANQEKNEVIRSIVGDREIKETYFTLSNYKRIQMDRDIDLVSTAFIPNIHKKHILPCTEAVMDGEKVFITNFSPDYYNGSFVLDAMPCFEEGEYSYLIVDNSMNRNQWSDFINRLNLENLHVYDIFNKLNGCYITNQIFNSQTLLYSFIDRYKSCVYCSVSNQSIIDEARAFQKEIEVFDTDGNRIEKDISHTYIDGSDIESMLFC